MGKDCGSKTEKPTSKAETNTTPSEEDALGNVVQTDNNKTYSKYNYNALNLKTHQTLRKHHSYTMISYLREKNIIGSIRISKQDSSFVGVETKGKMSLDDFDNLVIKIDKTSITNKVAYDRFIFDISSEQNGKIINLSDDLKYKIIGLVNKKYNAEVNKILENSNSSTKIGQLETGVTVDVKQRDSEKHQRGTIAKKINNNRYDILYQNGDVEMRVDKERIRAVDRITTMSELVGPISKIINKVLKPQNKDGASDYSLTDVAAESSASCQQCSCWDCGDNSCGCCFSGTENTCGTAACGPC